MTFEQLLPVLTLLLGTAVGFFVGLLRDWIQRRRLRREVEVDRMRQLVAESVSSAQWCGSTFDYLRTLRIDRDDLETAEHSRVRDNISQAVSQWNTAMYQLFITSDQELVDHLRLIDRELSTLYEQAVSADPPQGTDYRDQLGRLLVGYINEARRQLSAFGPATEPLAMETLWSWADQPTTP